LSKKSVAGTYEVEVMLGSQEVCLLELDLPESKSELRSIKIDSAQGQESFRGLLAGIFSARGREMDTRHLQVYDLLEGISTVREAVQDGESFDKIRSKLSPSARDEVAQGSLLHFFHFVESISRDKLLQMLSAFSKYLLSKKESLPKVGTQQKSVSARWDRVAKNILSTDEPTQEVEINPLEEGVPEEADSIEGEWHDDATEEAEPEEAADSEELT
jgi:hypothetical protein